jgi:uracil-DNA glycosylase family 4
MNTFVPEVFPEEAPPAFAEACGLCELAKQRKRVIWGEGNPEAPIYMILDNPGAREDKEGNPFVCGTRETLQQGLHETGLDTNRVYVTYLLKCRPIRAYNKPLARETCMQHLQFQLEGRKPKLLFCLGNVVVQSLFHNPEADVKQLRGQWHEIQGIPAAVTYHPLAVRRRPVLMPMFLEDLKLLKSKADTLI